MEDLNQVQWPKQVQQKIIDQIFGKPVPPEVAESMGLYEPANKLFTKLFVKNVQERRGFTDQQRAEKGLSTRQGEVPYDLVYTKDGYTAVPPGMSPHTSGQTNLESPTSGPGFQLDYNEKGDVVAVPLKDLPTLSSATVSDPSTERTQEMSASRPSAPQMQNRPVYRPASSQMPTQRISSERIQTSKAPSGRGKRKRKSKNKFSLRNLFGMKEKAPKESKGTPRYL